MDPKVKNLLKWLAQTIGGLVLTVVGTIYLTGIREPLALIGFFTLLILIWRACLSVIRRKIIPAKAPLAYGKWAVITGSTSGIGKAFAEHLASKGMSLLLVSRNEKKLDEQKDELTKEFKVPVRYLAFDFTQYHSEQKTIFYSKLGTVLKEMDKDGGVGLLINNVGTANEVIKR